MRARARVWVLGCGVSLVTVNANAEAPTVAFPQEAAPASPPTRTTTPANETPANETPANETPAAPTNETPAAGGTTAPPVTTTPAAVTRQPPAQAPQPKALPWWNIGAGIYFASGFDPGITVPSYEGGFERRLGDRTWLGFNARFARETRDLLPYATQAEPNPAPIRIHTTSGAVLLGLRHVFAHGVVDVSVFAAAFGRFRHVNGDLLKASGASGLAGAGNGSGFGLLAGLAVERELLDALSLRLSLDLASVSIESDEATRRQNDGTEQKTSLPTTQASVGITPSLQLRFYF
jgi:hypothetical protein